MSQAYVDDVYDSTFVVQTTMANIENNFAALKSAFSGAAQPSNMIAGMWWFDTTANILKLRNEANTAWQSVWDFANNKPVITNLSNEITGAMISATIKDAVAGTASLRTLGTGALQACAGNDARLSDTRTPGDASVSQAKLKTSQGSSAVYNPQAEYYLLPGGEYGLTPQIKKNTIRSGITQGVWDAIYYTFTWSTSTNCSNYTMGVKWTQSLDDGRQDGTIAQRYVTSSGEVHWIFILRNKETGIIENTWQAPDHPCFGNGGNPLLVPHPFGSYDSTKHEIIVINPSDEDVYNMEQACVVNDETKPDRDLLEVILQDYEIDEELKTPWPKKEVTVGLPKGVNWKNMPDGSKVIPIKKKIPKPSYITTRKLWKK